VRGGEEKRPHGSVAHVRQLKRQLAAQQQTGRRWEQKDIKELSKKGSPKAKSPQIFQRGQARDNKKEKKKRLPIKKSRKNLAHKTKKHSNHRLFDRSGRGRNGKAPAKTGNIVPSGHGTAGNVGKRGGAKEKKKTERGKRDR